MGAGKAFCPQVERRRAIKIFISVHHYPPNYTGGAELRAHRTARALQQRGHTLQAFAIEKVDEGPTQGIGWQDEEYEGVPLRRIRFRAEAAPDRLAFTYNNPWIGDHLREFLAQVKPDVFHLFGGYLQSGSAIHAAADLNIPVVVSLTDYWFLCHQIQLIRLDGHMCTYPSQQVVCTQCFVEDKRRNRWPEQLFPGLMRYYWQLDKNQAQRFMQRREYLLEALNRADAIIAPSRFLGNVHIQWGVDPGKIIHARQGRSFPGLTADGLVKQPADHLRIGYIGQLTEIKGVHVLLQAVRQLPDARLSLQLYGDATKFPSYVKRLRRIAGHDPRIQFETPFRQGQLTQVFQELDVLVVPSLWYENSPNVILEAFGLRTPVIASELGGMAELVQHERNGLLFQAGDPHSLAEQLQRILDDPALLPSLAAQIEPVKSLDQEIDELDGIYRRLVNSKTLIT